MSDTRLVTKEVLATAGLAMVGLFVYTLLLIWGREVLAHAVVAAFILSQFAVVRSMDGDSP